MERSPATASQGLDREKTLGSAGRGSLLNLVGAVAATFSTFGLTLLVARGASPIDAGVFFSTTSVFVLAVAVGQLGTDTGLVYFISRSRVFRQPKAMATYFSAALVPVMVLACLMGIGMIAFARPLASVVNPDHELFAAEALRALGLLIPLAALENVALSATRGLGTMRPYSLLEQVLQPSCSSFSPPRSSRSEPRSISPGPGRSPTCWWRSLP